MGGVPTGKKNPDTVAEPFEGDSDPTDYIVLITVLFDFTVHFVI